MKQKHLLPISAALCLSNAMLFSGCALLESGTPQSTQTPATTKIAYTDFFSIEMSGILRAGENGGLLTEGHTICISQPVTYSGGDLAVTIDVSKSSYAWGGNVHACEVLFYKGDELVESFGMGMPSDHTQDYHFMLICEPKSGEKQPDSFRIRLCNPTDGAVTFSNLSF